jgi:hypothetical protein
MSGTSTIYVERIKINGRTIMVGAGDPNGVVSGSIGDVYMRSDGDGSTFHNTDGATTWASGGGGGAGTLAQTLDNGNTTDGNDIVLSEGDALVSADATPGSGLEGGAFPIDAANAAGDTSNVTVGNGTITVNSVPLGTGNITFTDGAVSYTLTSTTGARASGSNNFSRGAPASTSVTTQAQEIADAINDPANQFLAAGILSATAVLGVVTIAVNSTLLPGAMGNNASLSDTIAAVTSSGQFGGGWSGTTNAVGYLYVIKAPVGGATVLGTGSINIGGTSLTLASTTRTSGGNNFNRSLSTVSAIATEIAAAINDRLNAWQASYIATSGTIANDNTQAWVKIVARSPGVTPALSSTVAGVMTLGFKAPITADDGAVIINQIGVGNGGPVIAKGPLGAGATKKGNQRGPASWDLQVGRSDEADVVSGKASFATGYDGWVEGDYSRIGGAFCGVLSDYSVAEGQGNFIAKGSHYSAVFGTDNAVGYGAPYNFMAGCGNRSYGFGSAVFGISNNNFVAPLPEPADGGRYVFIAGGQNWGSVYSDLFEGAYSNYSATVGQSERNYGNYAVLAGFNNSNWSAYGLSHGFGNRISRPSATSGFQQAAWDQYRVQGGSAIPNGAGVFAQGFSHVGLAPFSTLGGGKGLATRFNQWVRALGNPTSVVSAATYTDGSWQSSIDFFRKESNNGASVVLETGTDGSGGGVYYNIRQNGGAFLRIFVYAWDVTSATVAGDCAAWEFTALVHRTKYTQATGTLTVNAGFVAGDTVTIGGVVLTATSTARISGARNFDISGGTTSSVAASLRSAMTDKNNFRSSGDVTAQYIASTSGTNPGPITLTAYPLGTAGNAVTLATSRPGTFTFSGATLSGGLDSAMTLDARTPSGSSAQAPGWNTAGAASWTVNVNVTNPNRVDITGTGEAGKKIMFGAMIQSVELTRTLT